MIAHLQRIKNVSLNAQEIISALSVLTVQHAYIMLKESKNAITLVALPKLTWILP